MRKRPPLPRVKSAAPAFWSATFQITAYLLAVSEVAGRLAACLSDGPRGRLVDFGGPEVLALEGMAEAWMEANGVRKRLVRLPLPGVAAKALRAGRNTAPEGVRGRVRWREWLERRARSRAAAPGRPAQAVR